MNAAVHFFGPCGKVNGKTGELYPPFDPSSRSGKFLREILADTALGADARCTFDNIINGAVFDANGRERNPTVRELAAALDEHWIWDAPATGTIIGFSGALRDAFERIKRKRAKAGRTGGPEALFLDHPAYILRQPKTRRDIYSDQLRDIVTAHAAVAAVLPVAHAPEVPMTRPATPGKTAAPKAIARSPASSAGAASPKNSRSGRRRATGSVAVAPGGMGIGPWHVGTRAAIAISKEGATELAQAMEGALQVIGFEERYAMLIDNMMEFETHLFRWSLTDMMRPTAGFDDLFVNKRHANRLFGNLLSSCRLYVDQTKHMTSPMLRASGVDPDAVFAEKYDAMLSYRTMEALRNYVQHEDLAVHTVRAGGGWVGEDAEQQRRYVVTIGLNLDYLQKSTKFKRGVLRELKALTVVPDMKQMIREYVSALGDAHAEVRAALAPQVSFWNARIEAAFAGVQAAHPDEALTQLAIFEQNDDGTRDMVQPVVREPFERLDALMRSNQTTLNLGPAYASSEALPVVTKQRRRSLSG